MANNRFPRLFEPCRIGTMEVPNRIVLPPMTTNFTREGCVTERFKDYYVERARGGMGLIIVEDAIVDFPLGAHAVGSLRIDEDRFIPALRSLTRDIKSHGSKVVLMLSHAGRRAGRVEKRSGQLEVTRGQIPVAPSSLPNPVAGYVVPRELSVYEIEDIVEKFAGAAARAREAGFDGVQFHGAHFYLIGQFLSPTCNKRRDKYGGDFEGRFRFWAEIIAATRKKVGSDYPVMCRMNAEEQMEGGLTQQDMQQVALRLQEAGVNAILLSIGSAALGDYPNLIVPMVPDRFPPGPLVPYAAALKKLLKIPVGVANKINSPEFAEKVLEEGAADLTAMGRTTFSDPELPRKAREGRTEDIRPCIGCLCCIQATLESGEGTVCTVNAALGRERELELVPAPIPKRVLVVGGGPAGMEAARVAKTIGHDVTLCERSAQLGGQLNIAARPPGKSPELPNFQRYLEKQIRKLGVKVELGKEAGPDLVRKLSSDVLIIAAGSRPIHPEIPGIGGRNVVDAVDVLEERSAARGRIAILGAGQVGLETAEFLAERGHDKITVIEMLADVGGDMPNIRKQLLLISLRRKHVDIITRTKVVEVTDSGVIVEYRGQRRPVEADTVVLALGAVPDREVVEKLKGLVAKTLVIGDCAGPGNIRQAVREGYEAAASI